MDSADFAARTETTLTHPRHGVGEADEVVLPAAQVIRIIGNWHSRANITLVVSVVTVMVVVVAAVVVVVMHVRSSAYLRSSNQRVEVEVEI